MEELSSRRDGRWKVGKLYINSGPFYERSFEPCLSQHRAGISDPRGLFGPRLCTWLKLLTRVNVYRMSWELASAQLAKFHGCFIHPTEHHKHGGITSQQECTHTHTHYRYIKIDIFYRTVWKCKEVTSYMYLNVYCKWAVFLLHIIYVFMHTCWWESQVTFTILCHQLDWYSC